MNDIYDINFQSNDEFCKIRIHCNDIRKWRMVQDLNHLCTIDVASIIF
jgi:hypothetical protein